MASTAMFPWLYAVLLAFVHYFGERIAQHRHRDRLASFASGVTVSYIFLQLLPEHYNGIAYLGEWSWFTVLTGFALLHASERYIYQHEKGMEQIRHDFKELHSGFLFLYYCALGVIIHYLVNQSIVAGTLFFVPVFLHTTISSLSLTELHNDIVNNNMVHAGIILAAVIGVGISSIVSLSPTSFHILLGIVTGMFLYAIVHDSLSQKEAGSTLMFIAGTIIYSGIIVTLWTVV